MSFLSPWAFIGLTALSLPILAHLIHRLRQKKVPWAAMRFIEEALRQSRSKKRINDLLLLLLRCLALLFLVLAFARPFIGEQAALATEEEAVILVLDLSASMGAIEAGVDRLTPARQTALELLDELPSRTPVGLLFATDRIEAIAASPTLERGRLRQAIQAAAPRPRGTNLPLALETAAQSLLSFTSGRVILVSDLQASAFEQPPSLSDLKTTYPKISFDFRPIGATTQLENLAVTDLYLAGFGNATRGKNQFIVEVTNFGSAPALSVPVRLAPNGGPAEAQTIIPEIAPGDTAQVALEIFLDQLGLHSVEALLPGDAFPYDDRRALAFSIADPARLLLVSDGQASTNLPTLFLEKALTPFDDLPGFYLRSTSLPISQLAANQLNKHDLVIWAASRPPTPPEVNTLAESVREGTGAIFFSTPSNGPALAAALASTLPGLTLLPQSDAAVPVSPPYPHPITARWNDPNAGNLTSLRFFQWNAVTLPEASPLLETNSGHFLGAEYPLGSGGFLIFGFLPDTELGNLPIHPAFLPLLHRSINHLFQASQPRLNLEPGDSFSANLPVNQLNLPFFLTPPGGDREEARIAGRTILSNGQARLTLPDLVEPGIYEVAIGQRGSPEFVFTVSFPTAESRLGSTLDLNSTPADSAPTATDPALAELAASTSSTPSWTAEQLSRFCLFIACSFFIAEWLLAHFSGASRNQASSRT